MSRNQHADADHPKAYRMRLLNVLVAPDLGVIMQRMGWERVGDALETKYHLLNAWDTAVEYEVIKLIVERLRP